MKQRIFSWCAHQLAQLPQYLGHSLQVIEIHHRFLWLVTASVASMVCLGHVVIADTQQTPTSGVPPQVATHFADETIYHDGILVWTSDARDATSPKPARVAHGTSKQAGESFGEPTLLAIHTIGKVVDHRALEVHARHRDNKRSDFVIQTRRGLRQQPTSSASFLARIHRLLLKAEQEQDIAT